MHKSMTNAQIFASCLQRHGVECLFGQSNPTAITLACLERGIRQVGYRQENAGAYMAQGYAMSMGKVPVVTAQNGPAAALLVPGLAECLKASHPLVAVVQQISTDLYEKNAFQEMDQERLFMGCAKWVKTILSAERIEDYVDMAFTAAASGRPGPAVLLCPVNIFNDSGKKKCTLTRTANLGNYPLDRVVAPQRRIMEAAEILARANAPVIYAGGGVVAAGAQQALRALQEKYALPVATTVMGKGGVDESHPLSIGVAAFFTDRFGMAKYSKHLLQEADAVLLVGNRTNQNGTDSWTLLPKNAAYIHIDVDPMEIGRNYESLRLPGDARETLLALDDALAGQDLRLRRESRKLVEAAIARAKAEHAEEIREITASASSPVKVERFMAELEPRLADNHVLVADASFSSVWIANFIAAVGGRRFLFPRGLAGLGWGLPMAMGAKIAAPDKPVFCLAGDGGFAHVWSELETCQRLGIKLVLTVLNNSLLGYQYYAELARFGNYTDACMIGRVDYVKVAESCGLRGVRVERPEAIAPALDEALAADGCVVIDLVCDPESVPPVGAILPKNSAAI